MEQESGGEKRDVVFDKGSPENPIKFLTFKVISSYI